MVVILLLVLATLVGRLLSALGFCPRGLTETSPPFYCGLRDMDSCGLLGTVRGPLEGSAAFLRVIAQVLPGSAVGNPGFESP